MSFLATPGVQRARFDHAARWVLNRVARPSIVLVGEYHGANLGDHLLGAAISSRLRVLGHNPALLTLHNLRREKVFRGVPILMGGGNIMDADSLARMRDYWNRSGQPPIAGVGLDFVSPEIFNTFNDFISKFGCVFLRSSKQAESARRALNKQSGDIIGSAPDMAWLEAERLRALAVRSSRSSQKVGINVLPLYLRFTRDGDPVCAISAQDRFHAQASKETEAYRDLVLSTVAAYQSRGYAVIHVPFDVGDDALARRWLRPIGVQCAPYTTDIPTVMHRMSACEFFVPTRFHAVICAMAAGIPAKPIPYALKNADLLRHFGFTHWAEQTPEVFCEDLRQIRELLLGDEHVLLSKGVADTARSDAAAAVQRAIHTLFER
jgi:hypothetical protein